MPRLPSLVPFALLVALAAGCGPGSPSPSAGGTLTVFAAASLRDALDAAATAYAATRPGSTIVVSTDSSAALATQIELGAPADVFLSADTRNAERLAAGGLAAGDPVVFAANALALVVPEDNPAAIESPMDLARPGVKVVAAGNEVPVTRYALELVGNLAAESGYPADFATAYEANVVSREDNVRSVLAKIALGEGDAGIVYASDAAAGEDVRTVPLPDGANVAASYAGIVVARSEQRDAAADFLAWVAGPEGQAVLARFGFQAPLP